MSHDDDLFEGISGSEKKQSDGLKNNEESDSEIEVMTLKRSEDLKEEKEDFDYEARAKEIFEKKGRPFMQEILPKLPKQRNGMRLLGVHEQSPLVGCGELYKLRVFRPDRPLATSEIFEDGTRIRFTNLSRLMSDDFAISKFKIEMVTFKVGMADQDSIGFNATAGIFEAEDVCNLTFKPFLEKKIKGIYQSHQSTIY